MPQISLYIDQATLNKIEDAARQEHVSISRWVADQLRAKVAPVYPPGFADLYGSLAEEPFVKVTPMNSHDDVPREAL